MQRGSDERDDITNGNVHRVDHYGSMGTLVDKGGAMSDALVKIMNLPCTGFDNDGEETVNREAAAAIVQSIMFSRTWAMPNKDTFSIAPIKTLVRRYLSESNVSVDPFARNKRWATYTNDLNPSTEAEYHMDAEEFLLMLASKNVKADLILFDPPYSPRQISECYKSIGLEVGMKETQSALLYQRVRNAIIPICTDDAVVISFGWNSVGMGKVHNFKQIEIMLCAHGGAHNDTIVTVERRTPRSQGELYA